VHFRTNPPPAMITSVFFISSLHKVPEMSNCAGIMLLERVTLLPRVLATSFRGGINPDSRHRPNQAETGK